jgi:protein-S-isoprenylcysteine O-methyltransferase Ste14
VDAFTMSSTTSPSPLPTPRVVRATANDCRTLYPPQWAPAMLRATGTAVSVDARPMAAIPPLPTRIGAAAATPIRSSGLPRAERNGVSHRHELPRIQARPRTHRIPPLALMYLAGLAAWAVARAFPALCFESPHRAVVAAGLGLLGVGCSVLGVVSFRRARTTVNPMNPGAATALVVSGVYRLTRNPMYLGFLLLLLGELAWLGSLPALVVAPAFILYLNRFQIAPEESALRERFGTEFLEYVMRVPRWL